MATVALLLAGCMPSGSVNQSKPLGLLDGTILLANDDGWNAPGIEALRQVLVSEGHKVVEVAPLDDRSGSSVSLTTSSSLGVTEPSNSNEIYAVDGTPADCVNVALTALLKTPPSLVISGINSGYNVGDDVNYSGTVGAAITATLRGVPSIAVSAGLPGAGGDPSKQYLAAARYITRLLAKLDGTSSEVWPTGTLLNVNYPAMTKSAHPVGVLFTQVADTRSMAADYYQTGDGTYERRYVPDARPAHGTDMLAVADGLISVSAFTADRGAPSRDYEKLGALVETVKP